MADIPSEFTAEMMDLDAHEVAQTAASAGLVASTKIKMTAIVRKNFIVVKTLPPTISLNKLLLRLQKRIVFLLFMVFYCVIIQAWLTNN